MKVLEYNGNFAKSLNFPAYTMLLDHLAFLSATEKKSR